MAVSGGQGVACAVLYRARAVAAVMRLPAYGVAVDADDGLPVSSKAAFNKGGRVLPLRCALNSIPSLALPLKKYFCGIRASSTCDKEDAAAALGHSEILRVKDAPRDAAFVSKHTTCVRPFLPCRFKRHIFSGQSAQKASEGVVFGIEYARHVFPDKDAGRLPVSGANKVNCI